MPACINCQAFDKEKGICTSIGPKGQVVIRSGTPWEEWDRPASHQILRCCTDTIIRRTGKEAYGIVLEVGSGVATTFRRCLVKNPNVTHWFATDPRWETTPERNFVGGSAAHLCFDNETFDWVCGFETIEHWEEYGDTIEGGLTEIYRVLKPGGHMVLTMPMYVHGAEQFYMGDHLEVKMRLLSVVNWSTVTFDDWRRDYHPLPRQEHWRTSTFTVPSMRGGVLRARRRRLSEERKEILLATSYQAEGIPSSWHIEMHAIK